MKTCKDCHESKSEEEFPKIGGGRRRNSCKPCYNAAQRRRAQGEYSENIRASWRAASKRYYSNPEVQHKRRLRKHGLTVEEYNLMFDKQDGRCAICKRGISLVIDHCHESSVVRGLLCNGCNLILGYAQDNRETLLSAITYLDDAGGRSESQGVS